MEQDHLEGGVPDAQGLRVSSVEVVTFSNDGSDFGFQRTTSQEIDLSAIRHGFDHLLRHSFIWRCDDRRERIRRVEISRNRKILVHRFVWNE